MAPKIFLTGATGYIGGDALYTITESRPDLEFSVLVRSKDKAEKVQAQYPNARVVLGELGDADTLRKEAASADIVIHTADSSDHEGAAKAIAQGLVEGHSKEHPGYWLHLGGTGILTYFDSEVKKVFGEPDDKVFNDFDGVDELTNLPSAAFHRHIDEIVLKTGTEHADKVKTVIVCPPTIYGHGRGPVSGRGRQVYELTSFILKEQYCPLIGKGLAKWNHVHIFDLSSMIELLVTAALDPARKDDAEIWGPKGYMLAENGEHTWGQVSEMIGKEVQAQGLSKGQLETKELSYDEAVKSPAGFEAASWGMNSRATAVRARKVLGWAPKEEGLSEAIPAIVKSEANLLNR
ncbi:NAD(P)H-binding domain-containing protein [Sarocladium implicatum]|nr:NAD(P)H-binding domain-containing protein [Sarocladium implicatum]